MFGMARFLFLSCILLFLSCNFKEGSRKLLKKNKSSNSKYKMLLNQTLVRTPHLQIQCGKF